MTTIPEHTRLLHAAANLAARMHRHQLRKDGQTPYLAHLMRVPLVISTVFGCNDPVVLAAAILHDVIEDTQADYDDIAAATSEDVARLVAALTKDMRVPEDRREEEYDRQLAAAPWQARLIKLADVYDNLCDSVLSKTPVKVLDKVQRALELAREPELEQAARRLRELISS